MELVCHSALPYRKLVMTMAPTVQARLDALEDVCAELYQVLSALGAPEHVLEQALAAAEGRDLPYPTLLPFSPSEAVGP